MAHGDDLACHPDSDDTCRHHCPHDFRWAATPPLIFSLEKQGPHCQWWHGNWQGTNNDNVWCLWTTDTVEVSTITPLPHSFFHTRNRGHVMDHGSSQMIPSTHAWTEPDDEEPRWVSPPLAHDLISVESRCHIAGGDVATKWRTMTGFHCSLSLCSLGLHGQYPPSHILPNPPCWNTGRWWTTRATPLHQPNGQMTGMMTCVVTVHNIQVSNMVPLPLFFLTRDAGATLPLATWQPTADKWQRWLHMNEWQWWHMDEQMMTHRWTTIWGEQAQLPPPLISLTGNPSTTSLTATWQRSFVDNVAMPCHTTTTPQMTKQTTTVHHSSQTMVSKHE